MLKKPEPEHISILLIQFESLICSKIVTNTTFIKAAFSQKDLSLLFSTLNLILNFLQGSFNFIDFCDRPQVEWSVYFVISHNFIFQ